MITALATILQESGIEQTQGEQIKSLFVPYFDKMSEVEKEISTINFESPSAEDAKKAREIRLGLKANRVAAEKAKTAGKENFLLVGRLYDSVYGVIRNSSELMENRCEEVEKFEDLKEEARKNKLQEDRSNQLSQFVVDTNMYNLKEMSDQGFAELLSSSKFAYEAQKEAEKYAAEERIAKEKADAEEREQMRLENIRLQKEVEDREKEQAKERAKVQKEQNKKDAELAKAHEAKAKAEAALEKKEQDEANAQKEAENKRLAEERVKVEADKKSQLAPDKEKIAAFAERLKTIEVPKGLKPEAQAIINDAEKELLALVQRMRSAYSKI